MTKAKSTTTYILDIPGWRPALANELMSAHWSKRSRLKRRDTDHVLRAATVAGVEMVRWTHSVMASAKSLGIDMDLRLDGPRPRRRRVTITIHGPTYGSPNRRPDPDGPLKSCLDALVSAGLLVDDSERWCEWERPRFVKGPKRTVITLEDMSDA